MFVAVLLLATTTLTPEAELADIARVMPAEFGAPALTRIAGSARITEPKQKLEFLQQAFEMVETAQEPFPRRIIPGAGQPAQAMRRHVAYLQRRDKLSMQIAALRGILRLKPPLARELFARVTRPALEPTPCSDALIPDVSDYFAFTAELANSGYSRQERAREDHLVQPLMALQSLTSPVEIVPALAMVSALQVTAAQSEMLMGKLASALERISRDDRAFTATLEQVEKAVAGTRSVMLEASVRRYVEANRAGERCKVAEEKQPEPQPDPEGQRLMDEAKALVFGASQAGPEWQKRLTEFVRAVDQWRAAGAPGDDEVFSKRVGMLSGVVWITPPGEERMDMLERLIGYLRQAGVPRSWMLWYLDFDGLLSLTRSVYPGQQGALLDAFERSGHPVLIFLARLERTLPRSFESVAP